MSEALTLSQRLAKHQESVSGLSFTQLQTMPVSELGQLKVDFGKVHKGDTFEHCMTTDAGWIKWCVEHLGQSEKANHKALLLYVEKYLDEAEMIEEQLTEPQGAAPGPNLAAKAKAAPKRSGENTAVLESGDQWAMVSPSPSVQADVSVLQDCMKRMEEVMSQVLSAIQRMSSPPSV